jgi:cytochrome c biogenesis protein CcmG/thiol:disulfide interchange protein DsbE
MNARVVWVLGIFIALLLLLGVGLTLNPREVPSPLIGKPAPKFTLPLLHEPSKSFSSSKQLGSVWLFNVWASWCVECREEHPVLLQFASTGLVPVYGLDYKDKREDGLRWLERYGDPYRATFFDAEGRVGIDYGVYGVPETFVIDKRGIIRFKQIGVVTPEVLAQDIIPLVRKLQRE